MEKRHIESARKILDTIHYITIATICEDGSPWNSPVSASLDTELNFYWGSSPENVHSQNIRRDGRVFVVVFDSNAPEGTGEGVYMQGRAEELDFCFSDSVKKYKFVPEKIWINDVAVNEVGEYQHDVRIELQKEDLV